MGVEGAALKELAALFAPRATLYAVGGYSRARILGVVPHDIDVCSKLTVDEVRKLLSTTRFDVSAKSMRLGTARIYTDGFSAEYTTFRTDSYPEGGAHRPSEVTFTEDMRADALRRDFTANAVYFDPLTENVVDFFDGVGDIGRGVLRAVRDPDEVFADDGLRVLRLVRFAAELGFEPERATFDAARRNAALVGDIVKERIFAELERIFVADTAYPALGSADGHTRGLGLLDDLGLIDMLLPELAALRGLAQPKKHHVYDAFTHSCVAYSVSAPEVRWAALLHDVGKRPVHDAQGNMHGHELVSETLVRARLAALGMPPKRVARAAELVRWHMVDLAGDMSEGKLRLFLARHADIADDLVRLKRADAFATKGEDPGVLHIEQVWEKMKEDGTPLSVTDLSVGGDDAAALGFSGREIGDALAALWREAVLNPVLRERGKALAFLERRAAKRPEKGT